MITMQAISFSPLLPWLLLSILALLSLTVLALAVWRRVGGIWWRAILLLLVFGILLNPILNRENRKTLTDILAVVVDNSSSNKIGDRQQRSNEALKVLEKRLSGLPMLQWRVSRTGDLGRQGSAEGTRLIAAVRAALSEIPRKRLAGVVVISDGQIHDISDAAAMSLKAPLHLMLTGSRSEKDRLLHIDKAPAYGIVGEFAEVTVRIIDTGINSKIAPAVIMKQNGRRVARRRIRPGQYLRIPFKIHRAGQTILELEVEGVKGELTKRNNKAVITVSGVRDRLRVLLISGQPHPGERTWRNILKSDPSVDLVHFTILRPPGKSSATPIRELSLISFPTRQLFQEKLKDFDLIIFDRFRRHGILASSYLRNVAAYVQQGGAVLTAAGPAFARGRVSLFRTPLSAILPAAPTGTITELGFRPVVTDLGKRHPVTAALQPAGSPPWGRWFRLIDTELTGGKALMRGAGNRPLLVLKRIGEGRVAQILSDQMWLWDRGYEGGGPQSEMLRRIAHWLMKEPELEEESLRAKDNDGTLIVERRSLKDKQPPIQIIGPDDKLKILKLKKEPDSAHRGRYLTPENGLYRVSDGVKNIIAAVGAVNPKEFQAVTATPDILQPVLKSSGGGIFWLQAGTPDLRRVKPERRRHGKDWAGLVQNRSYLVTGLSQTSLFPGLATMLMLLALMAWSWRRER